MKKPVSPHTVACLVLGLIAPLSAQNLDSNPTLSEPSLRPDGIPRHFNATSALPGTFELPASERAQGDAIDEPTVFATQDSLTLDANLNASHEVNSVVNLDILRKPSPRRKVMVSTHGQPYEISEDGLQASLAFVSAVYREIGSTEQPEDCNSIALSIEHQVKLDTSRILEIVEREVAANPDCSCEVVKSAIKASEADVDGVISIVETAIHASPESMRIISQCAIASMPESVAGVQALLAKLDPNAGNSGYSSKSAKSAKSAKVTIVAPRLPNPLDRPPPPLFPPPPIFPPPVTKVNPD